MTGRLPSNSQRFYWRVKTTSWFCFEWPDMQSSSPTKMFAGTLNTLHYSVLIVLDNKISCEPISFDTYLGKHYLNSFLVANKFGECHVKVIAYVLVLLLLVYQLICKEIDNKIDIKEISDSIPLAM